MTRPYTASERNDSKLFQPTWTYRGDYVFANSSTWPGHNPVMSEINIGSSIWKVRGRAGRVG
jgi:hypothetical protein